MSAVNNTSAAEARKLDNQVKALELRRMGKGYVEIGAALGISKSQAHRYVTEGMGDARAQVAAGIDEIRTEEISRLDAMLSGLWPKARRGEVAAVDRVLRIMERRARLLGLDAPMRVGVGAGVAASVGEEGTVVSAEARVVVYVPANGR
jgi:ribosomal protein L15E